MNIRHKVQAQIEKCNSAARDTFAELKDGRTLKVCGVGVVNGQSQDDKWKFNMQTMEGWKEFLLPFDDIVELFNKSGKSIFAI